jgi:hypothetical protein
MIVAMAVVLLGGLVAVRGVGQAAEPRGARSKSSVPRDPPVTSLTGAGGAGGTTANDAPKVKVERGVGGKKIYRITEDIRIEGKIQKPEAFFFYQKSSINYDWQELKQDFLPRIFDSVNRSPF